jgi:uncharacterized protein YjbI with pentapeptide repeats
METEATMQLTRIDMRLQVKQACLAASTFTDVNLSNATFDDVNFSGADIRNANLSGWRVHDVNFSALKISHADLRGASIVESLTEGMTIDGIAVADMMAAYRSALAKSGA